MFRIVCDPSSGSIELYLTEMIGSGSLMFVVCLVGVWQRNFEPVVCVYGVCVCVCVCTVHTHTHTPLVQNYAAKHRPSTRQTSVNHYEQFQSSTALYRCANSRTVSVSIPGGVIADYFRGNPDRTMCPEVDSTSESQYQGFLLG